MREVTMSIPAISCDHCQHTVESTLAAFEGVQNAAVDIPKKTVALTYDPTKVDLSVLEEALSEEGYDVADVR
jgi:copper chaperone